MKYIVSLLLLAMVLLQSCDNRREILEDGRVNVTVNLDWKNHTKSPNGATIAFFPRSGMLTEPVFLLTNYSKDNISLPIGVYDILVFNETVDGHDHISFKGTDKYETFEAYWDVSKLKDIYTRDVIDEAILNTDDEFLVERMEGFEITNEMVNNNSAVSLSFTPKHINIHMGIIVQVKGLANISRSGGLLYMSGMASGYNLSRGKPSGNSATHLVPLNNKKYNDGSITDGTMSAYFHTFGLSKDISRSETDNILRLVLKLRDGTSHPDIVRDISSSITEGENIEGSIELNIEIGTGLGGEGEDEEIVIPEVPDTEDPDAGSGFDGVINDWDDEVITDVPI